MRLDDALAQLDAIHAQVLRSETYQGFRALPTGATGAIAAVAATLQALVSPPADAVDFARWWIGVAFVAVTVGAGDLALYACRGGPGALRRSLLVLRQVIAPLGVGAILTMSLLEAGGVAVTLLPGMWALCFGLALVSARPFLSDGIGFAAGWYLVAGMVLMLPGLRVPVPTPLGMGVVFGAGQLATAIALRRTEHHDGT